jgi:hypothetical protein
MAAHDDALTHAKQSKSSRSFVDILLFGVVAGSVLVIYLNQNRLEERLESAEQDLLILHERRSPKGFRKGSSRRFNNEEEGPEDIGDERNGDVDQNGTVMNHEDEEGEEEEEEEGGEEEEEGEEEEDEGEEEEEEPPPPPSSRSSTRKRK